MTIIKFVDHSINLFYCQTDLLNGRPYVQWNSLVPFQMGQQDSNLDFLVDVDPLSGFHIGESFAIKPPLTFLSFLRSEIRVINSQGHPSSSAL